MFNNAVLGSGMFLAARYLNDRESEKFALDKLDAFITRGLFADGSYGEGYHYSLYEIGRASCRERVCQYV